MSQFTSTPRLSLGERRQLLADTAGRSATAPASGARVRTRLAAFLAYLGFSMVAVAIVVAAIGAVALIFDLLYGQQLSLITWRH